MRWQVALVAVVAALASVADAQGTRSIDVGTDVGELFPSLVLPALADGQPLAVSEFRGQKILLHQFASW